MEKLSGWQARAALNPCTRCPTHSFKERACSLDACGKGDENQALQPRWTEVTTSRIWNVASFPTMRFRPQLRLHPANSGDAAPSQSSWGWGEAARCTRQTFTRAPSCFHREGAKAHRWLPQVVLPPRPGHVQEASRVSPSSRAWLSGCQSFTASAQGVNQRLFSEDSNYSSLLPPPLSLGSSQGWGQRSEVMLDGADTRFLSPKQSLGQSLVRRVPRVPAWPLPDTSV